MLLYLGKLACRSELGRYPISIGTKTSLKSYLLQTEPWSRPSSLKGRTIRKVLGGGVGKRPKKYFMQGKMPRKKIHAKRKVKKKKIMQREGPIVTFSESLSLFRKVWVSEINNITSHNMNKKTHFLLIKRRQLEPCFCFKLQLVYLQHTLYTVL